MSGLIVCLVIDNIGSMNMISKRDVKPPRFKTLLYYALIKVA